MLKNKVAEPVPPMLIALIVGENVPDWVGVPEINPVELAILNPEGSPLAP